MKKKQVFFNTCFKHNTQSSERTMKSASMRKMMECLMVVLMVWSVFQIRNCITLQDVQYAQDRIHWDILAYELLFLASCFGFVTAMGTGILKKNHSEE